MSKVIKYLVISSLVLIAAFFYQPESPEKTEDAPPPESQTQHLLVETNWGAFSIELESTKAPVTVANFLNYVKQGFYKDTLFHRVIPGFVIQGGGFIENMQPKTTMPPIINESHNGLKNLKGTLSMARKRSPDSATSQFFINLSDNASLDPQGKKAGYTVFGQIDQGMEIIEKIAKVETLSSGQFRDVPQQEIVVISIKEVSKKIARNKVASINQSIASDQLNKEPFAAGEDYVVLEKRYPTSNQEKIEVLQAFSYGCGHCYGMEPYAAKWRSQQQPDIDFVHFPAVWNSSMKLYAKTFYAAQQLGVRERVHIPLFNAIVVEQKKLSNAEEVANFFATLNVDKNEFAKQLNSPAVNKLMLLSEIKTRHYQLASVPEIVVNGKYRVDPMRAGGQKKMFAIVDYLIEKERKRLSLDS